MIKAVTFNLGCGGPHPQSRIDAAFAWVTSARDQYDLVFAQETPGDEWLVLWGGTHDVYLFTAPKYRVRSAILVRRTALESRSFRFVSEKYHDSYVAVCQVRAGEEWLTCMSVHASPSEVADKWLVDWPDLLTRPTPRAGLGLWDSDMLLTSIAVVASQGPALIAGDWNEARDWDLTHADGSGAAFFERVHDLGIIDCTWSQWNQTERATCLPERGVSLQVDRIFATKETAVAISDCVVEPLPMPEFDHMPITFLLEIINPALLPRSSPNPPRNHGK